MAPFKYKQITAGHTGRTSDKGSLSNCEFYNKLLHILRATEKKFCVLSLTKKKKALNWLEKLPIELQIHIMTIMDVQTLESFVIFLGISLPGVVQYASDKTPLQGGQVETIPIRKLDTSRSMINIIYLNSFKGLNSKRTLLSPSISINHIVVSHFDNFFECSFLDELQCPLGRFMKSMSTTTTILFKDCNHVALKYQDLDLSRLEFQKVRTLRIQFCKAHRHPLERVSSVKEIFLLCCSGFTEWLNYESHEIESLRVFTYTDFDDPPRRLRNMVINTQNFGSGRLSEMSDVIFNGHTLHLTMDAKSRVALKNIEAKKLRSLKIESRGPLPKVSNLNAPVLEDCEIDYRRVPEYRLKASDFSFLKHVRKLTLCSMVECLLMVNFTNLNQLSITTGAFEPFVQVHIPTLRKLNLAVFGEEIMRIRADDLDSIAITIFHSSCNLHKIEHLLNEFPRLFNISLQCEQGGFYDFKSIIVKKKDLLESLNMKHVNSSFLYDHTSAVTFPRLKFLKVDHKRLKKNDVAIYAPFL